MSEHWLHQNAATCQLPFLSISFNWGMKINLTCKNSNNKTYTVLDGGERNYVVSIFILLDQITTESISLLQLQIL